MMKRASVVLTIDVAHPPRPAEVVEETLIESWSQVRNSASERLLKIIHGYGSSGIGGTTKELVTNWVFRRRDKFRAVISGESYDLYNPTVQELRKEIGDFADPDLGKSNPGITILWIR
jgi:hypothetical protein